MRSARSPRAAPFRICRSWPAIYGGQRGNYSPSRTDAARARRSARGIVRFAKCRPARCLLTCLPGVAPRTQARMAVLPRGCALRRWLNALLLGLSLDEGGDPVVQLIDAVEAAVVAGDDGDFRVRHDASPGACLRRGEQGAARAGDQQDRD